MTVALLLVTFAPHCALPIRRLEIFAKLSPPLNNELQREQIDRYAMRWSAVDKMLDEKFAMCELAHKSGANCLSQ